jgi:hypothetical protein
VDGLRLEEIESLLVHDPFAGRGAIQQEAHPWRNADSDLRNRAFRAQVLDGLSAVLDAD